MSNITFYFLIPSEENYNYSFLWEEYISMCLFENICKMKFIFSYIKSKYLFYIF